jgi:hypothetical protein
LRVELFPEDSGEEGEEVDVPYSCD